MHQILQLWPGLYRIYIDSANKRKLLGGASAKTRGRK